MFDKSIVNELFRSEDMRKHIEEQFENLNAYDIAFLIYNAPISIKRKWELLKPLGDSLEDFCEEFGLMHPGFALHLLKLEPREYCVLTKCKLKNGRRIELDSVTIHNTQALTDYLAKKNFGANYDPTTHWHTLEVWKLDKKEKGLKSPIFDYIVIDGEICYIDCFYGGYNVQIPFKCGDVIEVDSRPFLPLKHFVVINKNGYSQPILLYINEYSKIDTTPNTYKFNRNFLKSIQIPIWYDAKLFNESLPQDEEILTSISKWINGDVEKCEMLLEFIEENANHEGITQDFVTNFLNTH